MQDLGVVEDRQASPGRDVFPHDRVVFFSDAVFAIAITLLAIELKLPDAETIRRLGAAAAYDETTSLFIAYFVSFLVTGLFWFGHMQTWRYVTRVGSGLLFLNLLQLMFVALMPFATREYSLAFSADERGRFVFYALVLAAISLFSWLVRRSVVRQERLRERLGDRQVAWLMWRTLIPLLVFAAAVPLAGVLPAWSAGLVFSLVFPLSAFAKRRILGASGPGASDG